MTQEVFRKFPRLKSSPPTQKPALSIRIERGPIPKQQGSYAPAPSEANKGSADERRKGPPAATNTRFAIAAASVCRRPEHRRLLVGRTTRPPQQPGCRQRRPRQMLPASSLFHRARRRALAVSASVLPNPRRSTNGQRSERLAPSVAGPRQETRAPQAEVNRASDVPKGTANGMPITGARERLGV